MNSFGNSLSDNISGCFFRVIHPVEISNFLEEIPHESLKLLIVVVFRKKWNRIDFIGKLIDKPHNEVIIVAIVPVLELNSTQNNIVIWNRLNYIFFINYLP